MFLTCCFEGFHCLHDGDRCAVEKGYKNDYDDYGLGEFADAINFDVHNKFILSHSKLNIAGNNSGAVKCMVNAYQP